MWPLSNVSFVAFHYRSYGTFTFKRLHSGFTRYRNYRTIFLPILGLFVTYFTDHDGLKII
ncbi:hypothetical protein A7J08_06535 [Streptococcus suis]|uniref:Ribose-5-phosphate isomerase A n=1 Tax=Streptococcus suis TaxID=1307 RepID=A0A3Q8B5Z2_STRSU